MTDLHNVKVLYYLQMNVAIIDTVTAATPHHITSSWTDRANESTPSPACAVRDCSNDVLRHETIAVYKLILPKGFSTLLEHLF